MPPFPRPVLSARIARTRAGPVIQLLARRLAPLGPFDFPRFHRQIAFHRHLVVIFLAAHSFQQLGDPSGDAAVVLGRLYAKPPGKIFWQGNRHIFHGKNSKRSKKMCVAQHLCQVGEDAWDGRKYSNSRAPESARGSWKASPPARSGGRLRRNRHRVRPVSSSSTSPTPPPSPLGANDPPVFTLFSLLFPISSVS